MCYTLFSEKLCMSGSRGEACLAPTRCCFDTLCRGDSRVALVVHDEVLLSGTRIIGISRLLRARFSHSCRSSGERQSGDIDLFPLRCATGRWGDALLVLPRPAHTAYPADEYDDHEHHRGQERDVPDDALPPEDFRPEGCDSEEDRQLFPPLARRPLLPAGRVEVLPLRMHRLTRT